VHLAFEMPEEVTHKPSSEWLCTGHVVHVQQNSSPQGAISVGVGFDCYGGLATCSALSEPSLPIEMNR